MKTRDWLRWAWLLVCSLVLALVELFYLPLRFDGTFLPLWLGGFPLPVSALLAAVTLPMLTTRAGRLSPRLPIAGGPLGVWGLCVVVSAVPGPGGDIVLVPDWRALLLLACGALGGAIALGGVIGRAAVKP
jgi:hypothetical protein